MPPRRYVNQERSRAQVFADYASPPELAFRTDPVAWARDRVNVFMWSKQIEILESVRDNPRTAVHSCHQIGKSFSAALTVAWFLDCHAPGTAFAVTTAPTAAQVRAILWREINKLHETGGLRGRMNQTEWHIGSQLVAFGRKPSDYNNSSFQGLHAEHFLVVLDEACGIPKQLWDSASTLAANPTTGRILAIGNPDDPVGEFADNCKPKSGWNVIHVGAKQTPNFTGEYVPKQIANSLIHPDWYEDRKKKWGEESALFQSKCEGLFPTVGDPWQVIPLKWANNCRYTELIESHDEIEAGIDVGAGNDRTCIVVRRGPKVVHIEEFVSPDPVTTVGRLANVLHDWNVQHVKVDSIGIGWGLYGSLRTSSSKHNPTGDTTHNASVVPINVGESPSVGNEKRFANKRAELWWDVGRENCRTNAWDLSGLGDDYLDDVIHELTMPKYEIVDSYGKVKIESKEKIRERLRASPDLAEALLLAFYRVNWQAEMPNPADTENANLLRGTNPFDTVTRSPQSLLRGLHS